MWNQLLLNETESKSNFDLLAFKHMKPFVIFQNNLSIHIS